MSWPDGAGKCQPPPSSNEREGEVAVSYEYIKKNYGVDPVVGPPLGEGGLYGTFARYAQRFGKQTRTVEVTLTPAEICQIRDALSIPSASAGPQAEAADWKDDPSSDERWNAGLDFGMQQLCKALDVDPQNVTWDAATETVDGDVQAVMWNIIRTRFGEDFDPDAHPQPQQAETCQVIQGYPLCRDSCAKVGKCLHAPKPQKADGRGAVIEAFRNVDATDWMHLDLLLGFSEHGRFWRSVFEEIRAALSQAPATDGAAVTRPHDQTGTSEIPSQERQSP